MHQYSRLHSRAKRALGVAGLAMFMAMSASATLVSVSGISDFSQHRYASWVNYCAPAAGANLVYYFGATYPGLVQSNPYGPSAPADAGADDIIAGASAPPPLLGSLADVMMTSTSGGTTPTGLRDGLDLYLETHDGDSLITWDTDYRLATDFASGADFFTDLQLELSTDAGIILTIDWGGGGAPNSNPDQWQYDLPDGAGTGSGVPLSHAVTMVGFDTNDPDPANHTLAINDPANNGGPPSGVHNWYAPAEYRDYFVTPTASNITINIAGKTATIYGALVTRAVPEPSSLALLLLGAFPFAFRRRHRPGGGVSRGQAG